jgi:hypothetical protein
MLSSTFGEIAITNGDVADPQDRSSRAGPDGSSAIRQVPPRSMSLTYSVQSAGNPAAAGRRGRPRAQFGRWRARRRNLKSLRVSGCGRRIGTLRSRS